ncbi:ATP-dependent DNA/RNA helicase DHX36-like isoform X1 [Myxocyprinus asiaticus]|uniref:ATP-dependent DNA/RNA helicase DHX36-like isoform X1 n=2 Tax=Myxocyprinus asiaticus TaxID=70543 RepID=UPI0022213E11|nr:ATP-dependent DNA/RNA helicase DHX36-like isoform X1 [Myxocyprinus asiaticus]
MNRGYGSNRRGRGGGGGRRFGDGGSRWDGEAGSSGGRGGYQRHSEWDSNEEQGHGGGRRGGDGGPRGKHPPHLKGREIGLWYAKWGGKQRADAERKSRAVVQMDETQEQRITQLLHTVQRDPSRDAHPSTSQTWRVKEEPSGHSYFDGEDPPQPENVMKVSKIEPKEEKQEVELQANVKKEPYDSDLEYLSQSVVRKPSLDEELKNDQQKKREKPRYLEMLKFREKLPSYGMKEELVRLISANQVLVISGETGCGKTTQVTQFILDDYIQRGMGSLCRVVCTQPRRISAISVAERVAAERAESVGEGKSCGYQIRLQSRLPRKQGSVLYCTTGIILQWLRSDPNLSSISHLVLDEIHERSLQSDVLLTIVKDLLTARDDLKVVLMSATLNAEKFSRYFDNCPMVHIPGYTYPVQEYLLEDVVEMLRFRPQQQDCRPRYNRGFFHGKNVRPEKEHKEAEYNESWPCYARTLRDRYSDSTIDVLEMMNDDDKINLDLIVALIRHIVMNDDDGAILVFLPGWDNISSLNDLLTADQMFKSDRFIIIPLHSLMPTVSQTQVFKKPPPGVRKIVIATNIAETSITIDDVVYVIDGGKIKETHFDTQNNISTMAAEWVSLANAKQRKGRAGRVSPGKCYHLYNGLRASLLDNYQLPEIQRTPLEELCLQIKILKLGSIASFFRKNLDPPSEKAIELAITHLMDLNALDRNEELTPLGFHLARLPVEPHIGKMILFGALLGCLDPVLTIAASLSFKDPFYIPLGKEKIADHRRKILSKNSRSDHLTIVNAFLGWEDAKRQGSRYEREYCWENFLSASTLQMLQNMKGQFAEHLWAAGFVKSKDPKDPSSNINSENEKLIKAVIVAGLYPKVAKIRPNQSKKRPTHVKVYTKADGKVCIHPKSVNAEETEFHYTWLIYHLKMRTTSIFLYDCTEVSPFSLLFFGGDISIQKDQDQETIAVDEWIVFQSPARIAHLVKDLRKELDVLLEEKIKSPRPVDWNDCQSKDCNVISAIIDLITTQETPAGGPRRGSQ